MGLAEKLVLRLSLVIGRFRSVNCSSLEMRVLLVKLSRSVRSSFFQVSIPAFQSQSLKIVCTVGYVWAVSQSMLWLVS